MHFLDTKWSKPTYMRHKKTFITCATAQISLHIHTVPSDLYWLHEASIDPKAPTEWTWMLKRTTGWSLSSVIQKLQRSYWDAVHIVYLQASFADIRYNNKACYSNSSDGMNPSPKVQWIIGDIHDYYQTYYRRSYETFLNIQCLFTCQSQLPSNSLFASIYWS